MCKRIRCDLVANDEDFFIHSPLVTTLDKDRFVLYFRYQRERATAVATIVTKLDFAAQILFRTVLSHCKPQLM